MFWTMQKPWREDTNKIKFNIHIENFLGNLYNGLYYGGEACIWGKPRPASRTNLWQTRVCYKGFEERELYA